MEQSTGRPSAPMAAILAIVGGALLAIGSFLTWAEVSGGGTSVTATGIDGSDGWITLVCGSVVLVAGLTFLRTGGKRAIAVFAILAGIIGGGLGLYDALTAEDRVLDDAAEELATEFGGTKEEVRALLDEAIDSGQLGISLGVGLYMVIAGGALGIVGGILGLRVGPDTAVPMTSSAVAPEGAASIPPVPPAGTAAPQGPAISAPEAPGPTVVDAPVLPEPPPSARGGAWPGSS